MSFLASWLLAFGVGDVVRDLSGGPGSGLRSRLAPLAGTMAGSLLLGVTGHSVAVCGISALAAVLLLGLWGFLRRPVSQSEEGWALVAIAFPMVLLAALLLLLPFLPAPDPNNAFCRWLAAMPFGEPTSHPPERVALIMGVASCMLASGNALVRLTLTAFEIRIQQRDSESLRGGRLIGPMERLLILGFVLANAPEAAALVVAARG